MKDDIGDELEARMHPRDESRAYVKDGTGEAVSLVHPRDESRERRRLEGNSRGCGEASSERVLCDCTREGKGLLEV